MKEPEFLTGTMHKEIDVEIGTSTQEENMTTTKVVMIGVWHDYKSSGQRAFLSVAQTEELIARLQQKLNQLSE